MQKTSLEVVKKFKKYVYPVLFILVVTVITMSRTFASHPVGTPGPDDTGSLNLTALDNTFTFQPDSSLQVDNRLFKAGLLYDVDGKKVVWAKDMYSVFPIASLTKMMVALLTAEDVKAGKFHWDDKVQWARETIMKVNMKTIKVSSPANYTLHDLFKAAMIASNNEAAEQMARYIGGGDLSVTIARMNERARELGMNSTYYGNPTGLPAYKKKYDNSSCPSDLLYLSVEMLKHKEILEVTGMDYADVSNGNNTTIISNHNHLAIDYKGQVDGMKTGYTKRAGFCLVATANKCNHRLISIVLGARAPITRNEIVKNMFNDYYTSVGLDKLSPYCIAPAQYASAGSSDEDSSEPESEAVYQPKSVIQIHVVQKGELLASIAEKYNVNPTDIRKWNHLRSSHVARGQKLLVKTTVQEKMFVTNTDETQPETVAESTSVETAPALQSKLSSAGEKFVYHVVQPGDTLFSIARHYSGISVEELKVANNISDLNSLQPGTKIKVPLKG